MEQKITDACIPTSEHIARRMGRAPQRASTHSRRREISFFFPRTHAARAPPPTTRASSSPSSSSSSSSRFDIKKKETYRNYQTPLDRPRGRPRGRPPVCSSGAAARIRSPSAPPGRSRRWMTTPVPVPVSASVPVPLPVRSTGVNPRNHPPSWTCSLHFVVVVVVVVGRARRTPRSSRVACWRQRVGSRPVDGWMDFNRCTL